MREGDQDGGSSGHPDDDVGAEVRRGHCCSAMLIMMMGIYIDGSRGR